MGASHLLEGFFLGFEEKDLYWMRSKVKIDERSWMGMNFRIKLDCALLTMYIFESTQWNLIYFCFRQYTFKT